MTDTDSLKSPRAARLVQLGVKLAADIKESAVTQTDALYAIQIAASLVYGLDLPRDYSDHE